MNSSVIDLSKAPERKDVVPMPAASESAALISVIERAARDPNVDIEKMERLMGMHDRIVARTAAEAFSAAFSEMQTELPEIDEHGKIKVNNEVRSTYATFEDINAVVKPILARHGFGISFKPVAKENKANVTAVLMHRQGHKETAEMELAADTSGGKNGVQALGSSVSYAKRYLLCGLLNITTRGEDDDGRRGGDSKTLSEKQVADLHALLTEHSCNIPAFLKWAKVRALEEILAKNFDWVCQEVHRIAERRR